MSGRQPLHIEVSAGEVVAWQGEKAANVFILEDGRIEILREVDGLPVSLEFLGPGDIFGAGSLLPGGERGSSARAQTDCRLLQLDAATFEAVVQERPQIALELIRRLSTRLRRAEDRFVELRTVGRRQEADATQVLEPLDGQAVWVDEEEIDGPRLVDTASGRRLALPARERLVVGRRDLVSGVWPEVDLSAVDPRRSVSRRHALLLREGESYLLHEEAGTPNGTFLNDRRLEPEEKAAIRDGDLLRFGLAELRIYLR